MKLESNRRVAACAAGFALPRYAELPTVGLYLDQSVQFVNGCFRTFQGWLMIMPAFFVGILMYVLGAVLVLAGISQIVITR